MLGDNAKLYLDRLLNRYPDKFGYGNSRRVLDVLEQDEPDFSGLATQEDWILYYNADPGLRGRSFQDLKESQDPFYMALKGVVHDEEGNELSDDVLQEFFEGYFMLEPRDEFGRTIRPVDLTRKYRPVCLSDILKKQNI